MFQRILLPMDLTRKHQAAFASALDLAQQSSGEVVLLHVVEVIPGVPMEEDREFYERLEQTARTHLNRYRTECAKEQVACRVEIRFGNRAPEIALCQADAG
jgi:nucleotide-binding universal stress UspA family protein